MSSKSKASRAKSTAVLSTMVLLGIFAAFTPKTWARYSGGTGDPNDPYRIATAEDLNDIGNYEEDWDKHFTLVNDVNLAEYTGTQFKIIGNWIDWSDPNNKPFTGFFDGNNHKIWNFTWRSVSGDCIGLFRYIGGGGQIKNLALQNIDVNSVNGDYIGGLVGFNEDGIVTNSYSSGSISGTWVIAGLVGLNYEGTITNSCTSVTSLGYGGVGGLVGQNFRGTITNCHSSGNVTGEWQIGGLAGENSAPVRNNFAMITNCYSTSRVSGGVNVGGLVGKNECCGTIAKCYSSGTVSGRKYYVGGLVGSNSEYGTITNCYSSGSVSGKDYVGGLVGENRLTGTINYCYSTGSVSGSRDVGGLVGYAGSAINSFWDIETSGRLTSAGGEPKTTAEMQTRNTFTDSGWDFIEIWGIGENQTYPYLRFAPAGDFNYDKKVDLIDLAILAEHWLAR